jgi:glucose-1-phosphate cytidylyltransferase
MIAVILCGGKGSRLAEETHNRPKPLVKIGSAPILSHILNMYFKAGISDFVLALGYLGNEIINHYNNHWHEDAIYGSLRNYINLDFVETGANAMTGGRIHALRNRLSETDEFLLTYGDGVSDVNIGDVIKFHKSHKKTATITAVHPPARFGVLEIENFRVTHFREKSQTDLGWINGGFFVFNKSILDLVNSEDTVLEEYPLEYLASSGELMAFKHHGFWQCMDTIRDKEYLEDIWYRGQAPWK